jgi:nucleoside-diphosphate-sugar epimerase
MRVFVTGSTGFIGSATVNELLAAGHEVLGLVRSDEGAAKLAALGVPAHRGDLTDLGSLVAGAQACDGVIHTGFIHDFSRFAENIEVDRLAVQALVGALEGTGKPLAIASGTALAPLGQVAVEQQAPRADAHRADAEAMVMAAAGHGVRGSIVRLSPTVHGAGDHGFVPMLIGIARRTGVAAYVGDGANRWPAVHRLDAAKLFRLAVEQAPAGTRLHAAAEAGVPMRTIAETIGAGLGIPVHGLSRDEAAAHFGWMAFFVGMDNPTSSTFTRELLGWQPTGPELLADLRDAGYFA